MPKSWKNQKCDNLIFIEYDWIAHQMHIGTTLDAGMFAVEVQFQIRDQFWIPQPELHGAKYLFLFCKISKHAGLTSRPEKMFSGGV